MSKPAVRCVMRERDDAAAQSLIDGGLHPLLARLYAARGVRDPSEVGVDLSSLLAPSGLAGMGAATTHLANAVQRGERILVVADYDCDGATACAVALRGLRMLGATSVDFLVPNRFVTGYGLSPAIVEQAVEHRSGKPDWILTVDNGIASVEGVDAANACGMRVIVTDHHLAGEQLPKAAAIVNPNQPGCAFASKHLAGVGVMFYVLLALRAELRARGAFDVATQPRLELLLDLVALGTVADVVRLDANNRTLVEHGLKRMRHGRLQPGLRAIFDVAGRRTETAAASDLGFAIAPRINAAGRLEDMTVGIECLITDDAARAEELAHRLNEINGARRGIESEMKAQAQELLAGIEMDEGGGAAICLYSPQWHEGVVGIVAGRLKEDHHKPTFVFAPNSDGSLRGSGRSIPGFHLRDALDLVSKREPGLLVKFGGHAMAAGCTIKACDFDRFRAAFIDVAKHWLGAADVERRVVVDGDLPDGWFTPDVAQMIESQVWGQGFEAPLFVSDIEVLKQRTISGKHLSATVLVSGQEAPREMMVWNRAEPLPDHARVVWRLSSNTWNGATTARMVFEDQCLG